MKGCFLNFYDCEDNKKNRKSKSVYIFWDKQKTCHGVVVEAVKRCYSVI